MSEKDIPTTEVTDIIRSAKENLPWKDDRDGAPRLPEGTHPMAVGLRRAKLEIAKILSEPLNIANLGVKLQEEFDKDPAKFLRMYEPLLRRYEDTLSGTERRPLRIKVREATIEEAGDG